jgi:hypothetical protein
MAKIVVFYSKQTWVFEKSANVFAENYGNR